jgi:hypothetical protein
MSKSLNFNVTLTFSDKICDDMDIQVIADNIARAIMSEAERGSGIAPDYGVAFTTKVEVKPQFIEYTAEEKINGYE